MSKKNLPGLAIKCCLNCEYGERIGHLDGYLYCRRNAPSPLIVSNEYQRTGLVTNPPSFLAVAAFPRVEYGDWCGEFMSKPRSVLEAERKMYDNANE